MGLLNAHRFAETLNLPLNTAVHVTFRGCQLFDGSEPTLEQTRELRALLLATLHRFATDHDFLAAYLWALERVTGRGLHAHVLLYLPEQSHDALRDLLQRAIEAAFCWRADCSCWPNPPRKCWLKIPQSSATARARGRAPGRGWRRPCPRM
ncbi:hypothetical protein E2C05_22065, partial [Paracraurococcus ruber]